MNAEDNLKVTVAVALYNNEGCINKCIDSILCQSYTNLEIIIVNDGSTDGSFHHISRYNDNRIIVVSKENGGLSSARQAALSIATGDYICFIDADDYLNEDYIKNMLYSLVNLKSDLCVCGTLFVNSDGEVNKKLSNAFAFSKDSDQCVNTEKDLASSFSNYSESFFMGDSWNKMYKLSFLKRNLLSFSMPKGFNGTDTLFNYKVLLCCPIISYIKYIGYVHVSCSTSAVHRKNKQLQESFLEIERQLIGFNKNKGMKKQLSIIHYRFMLTAFQDAFLDFCAETNEVRKHFVPMIAKHKDFVKTFGLSSKPAVSNNITIFVFSFLLNVFPFFLPAFLRKRARRMPNF